MIDTIRSMISYPGSPAGHPASAPETVAAAANGAGGGSPANKSWNPLVFMTEALGFIEDFSKTVNTQVKEKIKEVSKPEVKVADREIKEKNPSPEVQEKKHSPRDSFEGPTGKVFSGRRIDQPEVVTSSFTKVA